MILIHKNISYVTPRFDDIIPILCLQELNILNLNGFLWHDLPGALQWQWFVHVGVLSIFPSAVEREDSPQHNVPILR